MRLGLECNQKKSKLPPKKLRNFRCAQIIFLIIFIVVISCVLLYWGMYNARPVVIEIADDRAGDIAVLVINEAVGEEIRENKFEYDDFVTFEKSEDGKIQAIYTNVSMLNSLKTGILERVQRKMNDYETIEIKIPLGAIFDIELFPGMGPKIGFEMISAGFANADFKSDFSAAGINQTKHQIDIVVEAELGVVTIMGAKTSIIKTSVPVAQSIVVGEVPKGYLPIEKTY